MDNQLGEVEIDDEILAKRKEGGGGEEWGFNNKGEQFYSIYKSR